MPNPLNYGTLEACQRLQKAGIVLETDFYWVNFPRTGWGIVKKADAEFVDLPGTVPAPSMAEVWRELPDRTTIHKGMTDAVDDLIDLLVWVTEERS